MRSDKNLTDNSDLGRSVILLKIIELLIVIIEKC